MKKILTGVMTAALVFAIGTAGVSASGRSCGRRFTGVNGDGLCDRSEVACQYVDENDDGICDHYAERRQPKNGSGRGHHKECQRR